jgi:hypothetical protein
MNKSERDVQRKLRVLKHAEAIGEVAKTCRYFGTGRASFYSWRTAYQRAVLQSLQTSRCLQWQSTLRSLARAAITYPANVSPVRRHYSARHPRRRFAAIETITLSTTITNATALR